MLLIKFFNKIPDEMIDHNRIWRMQERIQSLRDFGKFHSLAAKYLLHIFVASDELALLLVLKKIKC